MYHLLFSLFNTHFDNTDDSDTCSWRMQLIIRRIRRVQTPCTSCFIFGIQRSVSFQNPSQSLIKEATQRKSARVLRVSIRWTQVFTHTWTIYWWEPWAAPSGKLSTAFIWNMQGYRFFSQNKNLCTLFFISLQLQRTWNKKRGANALNRQGTTISFFYFHEIPSGIL